MKSILFPGNSVVRTVGCLIIRRMETTGHTIWYVMLHLSQSWMQPHSGSNIQLIRMKDYSDPTLTLAVFYHNLLLVHLIAVLTDSQFLLTLSNPVFLYPANSPTSRLIFSPTCCWLQLIMVTWVSRCKSVSNRIDWIQNICGLWGPRYKVTAPVMFLFLFTVQNIKTNQLEGPPRLPTILWKEKKKKKNLNNENSSAVRPCNVFPLRV